jgi:HSP20 family protein|uniref:SHSP domain-containing protein n=1 Tax=Mimiviridae sp. ChoanoV1 TaxID=2596887 RepID=A0A5B8IQ89_9VIRU|nr:hypothetical protein 4_4 [Mimiviridae sp. ChoanoV1]
MSFNHNININNLEQLSGETISKFNNLGTHVIESLFDIATPIINNVGVVNIPEAKVSSPNTNVKNEENDIKILIFLPGVKKEDINLFLRKNYLEINAKTSMNSDEWSHIKDITYKKKINIPNNISNDDLNTNFENGILKIIINKNTKYTKEEKININ